MFKKTLFLYLGLLLLISFNLEAKNFTKTSTSDPVLTQEGSQKHWCPVCGMSIKKYYKTSHSSSLQNETKRQYCSIRCLAVDMKEYGIDTNNIKVIDAKSEKSIDAKKAFYLIGSRIKGTMSKVSKLAFKEKNDAITFQKKYKGEIVSFDVALQKAKQSLKSDTLMLQKKKEKKVYPKGKKLYEKKCTKNIDLSNYLEINELKVDLKNNKLCKPMKEKQLQSVALYLWEVQRAKELGEIVGKIEVTPEEKCPVCGMFVAKYPRWVAQIIYGHGDHQHKFSFDGVKDLMKFYFNSKKWGNYPIAKQENISKILVTDYYSQKAIDGKTAFYVIGSDIYGPMGHELIPFQNKEDAEIFKADHYGKKVINFNNIREIDIYKLD